MSGLPLNDPHGGFRQHRTGYLDTVALLQTLRELGRPRAIHQVRTVDPARVEVTARGIRYQHEYAGRVVFCEGFRGHDNPWFSWLPFAPVRGEILTLAPTGGELPREIISADHWLLPTEAGLWRLGATHVYGATDRQPSVSGRQLLLEGYRRLLQAPPRAHVAAHLVGVRPATRDRQPFIGNHPHSPRVSIFNGFGGRGSLLIPWYAERFADFLCGDGDIPAAADIRRFDHAVTAVNG